MSRTAVSIYLSIVVTLILFTRTISQSSGRPSESYCSNYTPKGYDPTIAPETDTEVSVKDLIRSLTKLDETEGVSVKLPINKFSNIFDQFMELQFYTTIKWKDERLFSYDGFSEKFKTMEPINGTTIMELPRPAAGCLWTGMVQFDELLGGEMFDSDLSHPYVEFIPDEKKVQIIARYRLRVLCNFNLQNYPMDYQECTLTFKPRLRANYYLVWQNPESENGTSKFMVSSFSLIGRKKWIKTDIYGRKTLKETFKFQRRIATAVIGIYFPSTLIVFISFVSFWVDALAVPGRVTLVITAILALMTQLVAVRDKAAPVSYVTALDIWFFACLAFVSFALFEFALAYNYATKRDTISRISSAVEEKADKRTLFWRVGQLKRKIELSLIPAPGLDGISRFAFPILFILFCLSYWIYYGMAESKRVQMSDDH